MPETVAVDLRRRIPTKEQTAAFAMTLLPPAMRLLVGGASFVDFLPADLSVAASVLASACLCDAFPEEGKGSANVTALAGLVLLTLSLVFPGIPLRVYGGVAFAVAVLGPCLLPVYFAGKRLSDKDFLVSTYSGWEVLLLSLKHNLLLVFSVLAAMGALTCLLPEGGGLAARLVSSFLLLAFEVLVALRRVMEVPLIGAGKEGLTGEPQPLPADPSKIPMNFRGIYARICRHMEVEKPFLKEGLTMDDMCRAMYTNKAYLSKVIRTCTSYNFSQFMNLYRVRYAIRLYRSEPSLKMNDLAALSGFRNTVSFNMAFRLFMDMTPGDWARVCRAEMEAGSVKARRRPSSPKVREP